MRGSIVFAELSMNSFARSMSREERTVTFCRMTESSFRSIKWRSYCRRLALDGASNIVCRGRQCIRAGSCILCESSPHK